MKPLAEMSALELRMELDAAIEAEHRADYVDGLAAWNAARRDARARHDAVIAEMARRRTHFAVVSGMVEGDNVG